MKKRFLILFSLITLLLTCFSFPIFAEEDPSDTPSVTPIPNSIRLDSYFYDNYDLLPYIESDFNQSINTGVNASNNLKIYSSFSVVNLSTVTSYVYGSGSLANSNALGVSLPTFGGEGFNFYNSNYLYSYVNSEYNIVNITFDKNNVYFNNNFVYSFSDSSFDGLPIYLFSLNYNDNVSGRSAIRLYSFYIYDYSNASFVKYYYPARSKSSGIIGLYDAVSDTFITTFGTTPFTSPVQDKVLNFQIGTFVTSSLGWIADILEFAITTPIILIFMAIGLAGAMFRWGRKLVHF